MCVPLIYLLREMEGKGEKSTKENENQDKINEGPVLKTETKKRISVVYLGVVSCSP